MGPYRLLRKLKSRASPQSSMRAVKPPADFSTRLAGSSESLLAQFSATTLELNPSLGTKEFARRLTARAAEMLGARSAVLVLARESDWEIAALSGPAHRWDAMTQPRLAGILAEQAEGLGSNLRTGLAERLLGAGLAESLGWKGVVPAPPSGSEAA